MKNDGNILKKEPIIIMIPGNKLQKDGNVLQDAGKKLKQKEINLKILGNEMIFVEIIRKKEIRAADFLEYPKGYSDWRLPIADYRLLIRNEKHKNPRAG